MDREALKKISDSSSPLMEKFRGFAPGTLRHCQNVSSLCESIAIELGLDPDIMRSVGLFHDIGKIYNPSYFTENQGDKNPHDDLEPFASFQIITRHVSDSVAILIQYPEIPRELIEIISQHHGNTVLASIYNLAKKKSNGTSVEDHYRYRSSSPTTTEAAILMVVDAVEATARSMNNNNKLTDVKMVVRNTIERLVQDKQLDELKIGVIRVIKEVLYKELESMYHKRIDYDAEDNTEKDILGE